MSRSVLLDAGPLVAGLNLRDQHHAWAVAQMNALPAPLHTCEAVLSEACFLLRQVPGGANAIMELLRRGTLAVRFRFADEMEAIGELLARYVDVPMSFADACLVRMAEMNPQSAVLTLDRDFQIYRKNRRQAIPTIMPRLER